MNLHFVTYLAKIRMLWYRLDLQVQNYHYRPNLNYKTKYLWLCVVFVWV